MESQLAQWFFPALPACSKSNLVAFYAKFKFAAMPVIGRFPPHSDNPCYSAIDIKESSYQKRLLLFFQCVTFADMLKGIYELSLSCERKLFSTLL